jgi:hypothetical protein
MTKLKTIYKELGIKYDLRAARKYLKADTKLPRLEVNRLLKEKYNEQNPSGHIYTLHGTAYTIKLDKKRKEYVITSPQKISVSFYKDGKRKVYRLTQCSVKVNVSKDVATNYTAISLADFVDTNVYCNVPKDVKETLTQEGLGSEKIIDVVSITTKATRRNNIDDAETMLFNSAILLPHHQFNNFKDSGENRCVPETLLHHIKLNNRNKKITLENVINKLNEYDGKCAIDEDSEDEYDYLLEGVPKRPKEIDDDWEDPEGSIENGTCGYTGRAVIEVLKDFNIRGRLVDINMNQFLHTNNFNDYDKHTKVFLGLCYDNHLYYCDNQEMITSLGNKLAQNKGSFEHVIYDRKVEEKKYTKEYIETNCLASMFKEQFLEDNTIRQIKTFNGKIVQINYPDKQVIANNDLTLMREIIGDDFDNENLTNYGLKLFNEWRSKGSAPPNTECGTASANEPHIKSEFNHEVLKLLTKHGNIVKMVNEQTQGKILEIDINKCRTDCLMNNRLGSYEVFGCHNDIKDYDGKIKKGLYFINTDDTTLFMRGNCWYSGDFLKYAIKHNIEFTVTHQLLCNKLLDANYFKKYVTDVVEKYPNHYKHIINNFIGRLGKTETNFTSGYIETDFDKACQAFYASDNYGVLYEDNLDSKKIKALKGKISNVDVIEINDNKKLYIVEVNNFKTEVNNDLPIYNKVLENEYIRLYELINKVGGNLIKISTDAISVDGNYNMANIKFSDAIGGYKYCYIENVTSRQSHYDMTKTLDLNTEIKWNITQETKDTNLLERLNQKSPSGGAPASFLMTALAGFGKSYYIKQLDCFNDDKTLRLGFTNCSVANIETDEALANTFHSYFGIDYKTTKVNQKKINNLKNINTIIITEIFMTPKVIMNILINIKKTFPNIRFICEGDPEQNRAVMEEHIDWINTTLLHSLCDGNMIKLTINKRNNETKNYHKIIKEERLDEKYYEFRNPLNLNITRTNIKRKQLNEYMMNKQTVTNHIILYDEIEHYEKGQDVYLNMNTPIMAIRTIKDKLRNGKMYKITGFDIINDESGVYVEGQFYNDDLFMKTFVVAYACTGHKIQGLTIKEDYNIYEWEMMTPRERYTAFSRCINGDNVRII